MPPKPDVTLLDIARSLGVSKAAVSLALAGKPGVSKETAARVQRAAKTMGYRPNPVQEELMALVRARRRSPSAETIAFINAFADPAILERTRGLKAFVSGTRQRARDYGYRMQVFQPRADGISAERLAVILKTRGIRGVILGPRWADEPEFLLPWNEFSCVLLGESRSVAPITRVCNHHAHTCALAFKEMASLGYKRIGLALARRFEAPHDFDFNSGVEVARLHLGSEVLISSFLHGEHNEETLLRWLWDDQIDALITLDDTNIKPMLHHGVKMGRPVGFAVLDADPKSDELAGVCQYTEDISASAVDILRGLLHAGARGVLSHPRVILIEGTWHPGKSAPRVASPRSKSFPSP